MNAARRIFEKIWLPRLARFKWKDFSLSSLNINVRMYRPFFILLVMTVIAYLLVGVLYKVLSLSLIETETAPVPIKAVHENNPSRKLPVESFQVIVERNLFGSTDKIIGGKPPSDKAQPVPDFTTLYALRGTVTGNGRYGFAILADIKEKRQRLYKVGDALGAGRITKIMRNAIAVKVGEEEIIMKIVETKETPTLPPPVVARQPSGTIAVNRNDLTDRLKNIGALLSQAQIRPYFSLGVQEGFLITNIRPDSLYQKLGINNGDIIQGVNNQKIRTADDMMALYKNLIGAAHITLNVKRQGRQENLQYVFN